MGVRSPRCVKWQCCVNREDCVNREVFSVMLGQFLCITCNWNAVLCWEHGFGLGSNRKWNAASAFVIVGDMMRGRLFQCRAPGVGRKAGTDWRNFIGMANIPAESFELSTGCVQWIMWNSTNENYWSTEPHPELHLQYCDRPWMTQVWSGDGQKNSRSFRCDTESHVFRTPDKRERIRDKNKAGSNRHRVGQKKHRISWNGLADATICLGRWGLKQVGSLQELWSLELSFRKASQGHPTTPL